MDAASSGINWSIVEEVPEDDLLIPLGKAETVQEGSDVTLVGWGAQVHVLKEAADMANAEKGISCEIIDLQTILPWDRDAIAASVSKTGRLVIAHEAPKTSGFGAEIAAEIQEQCMLQLKSPIFRVAGWDTPFPLVFEKLYLPDKLRCYEAIVKSFQY
jgi:2-oxoisovalerate dehydrogenase E1 component beta subunit